MLTATRLSKYFSDDVRAVRNVSLTLQPGQITALVGESGSGKSTLLNLLAGLADATSGEVRLDNKRVPGPADVLVPGHPAIRIVHQEYQLMPNVSIRENIAYALRFYEKNYRDYRVDELLKLCRLTDVQDRIPRNTSGGEKQRTAIARALSEPALNGGTTVLLLDEPFSHLDLPNRLIVRDLLVELVRQEQTACLLVTHDATDALSIADTLGIMRHGKLIQSGLPVEVYHQPLTAYAARMIGPANILKVKHLPILGLSESDTPDALICIRPEQIKLADAGTPATIRAVYFKGSHYELDILVTRYVPLRMLTTRADMKVGQSIMIRLDEWAVWPLKN